MSSIADVLTTVIELKDKYSSQAQKIVQATKQIDAAQSKMASSGSSANVTSVIAQMGKYGSSLSALANPVAAVTAVIVAGTMAWVAYGTAMAGAASAATVKAIEFERTSNALIAIEGNSKRAADAIKRMQIVALAPGLGVSEAIKGYAGLRRAGLSEGLSQEAVKQFGNANATAGGGPEQLNRVMLALSQMAVKGKVSGEELMQLSESGINAAKMLKDIYGTTDAIELEKRGITAKAAIAALTMELAKMPRVIGGDANAFDNLADGFDQAMIQMGGSIKSALGEVASKAADVLAIAQQGGVFQTIGDQIAGLITTISGTGGVDGLESAFVELAATVMTANDMITILVETVQGLIKNMPVAKALDALSGGQFAGVNLGDIKARNRKTVEMEMELGRKRAANAAKKPMADTSQAVWEASQERSTTQVQVMEAIARNTAETASNTRPLGETFIGNRSLTRVDTTAIRHGKHGKAAMLVDLILDLMNEQGIGTGIYTQRAGI